VHKRNVNSTGRIKLVALVILATLGPPRGGGVHLDRDITRQMHRDTFIAKLTESQQSAGQLLAQLEGERARQIRCSSQPVAQGIPVSLPTSRKGWEANRVGASSRRFRLPIALLTPRASRGTSYLRGARRLVMDQLSTSNYLLSATGLQARLHVSTAAAGQRPRTYASTLTSAEGAIQRFL
jgi:hypothetical protein